MKQHYFIKFDRCVNRTIGCQRATLILSTLEYWFSKKQGGFYKFIEPCSHPLYKKEDSWTEELNCDAKSFTSSFKKIGVKYRSRTAFEEAEDKFQGKMYASFYDRYSNRVFFVRNDEAVNKFFAAIYPPIKTNKPQIENKEKSQSFQGSDSLKNPLRNGKNSRSYKEAKNTSNNLSKDKSHASDEIIKKMIELWTVLVEEGRGQIQLTGKRISFLKKAFTDKFDSCLEKWKKYCEDIASSRFLMGEIKSSFRATLDWALKFDVIQKILEGNYGIGDRKISSAPSAVEAFMKNSKVEIATEEEIIQKAENDPEAVRTFRLKWLNKFGAGNYRECLKDCAIEVGDAATIILRPSSRYKARSIASYWTPMLLVDSPFLKVHVVQQEGDLVFDKWFLSEQSREGGLPEREIAQVETPADLTAASISRPLPETTDIVEAIIEKSPKKFFLPFEEEESRVVPISCETQILRKKLMELLPHNGFPTWLENIEVESVGRDGVVVVTLEDSLSAEWCRSRFSGEIFESAASVWRGVNKLIIRRKQSDTRAISVENLPKISESMGVKSTLEQAIESLLSVCSSGSKGTFGMQGVC